MMIDEAFIAQEQAQLEDDQIERELQQLKQMNNPIGLQGVSTLKSPRSQSFGTFGSNDRQQEPGQQMKSPRSLSFVQYSANGEPVVRTSSPRFNKEKTLNTRASTGQTSGPNPNPNLPPIVRTNSAQSVLIANRPGQPLPNAHLHAQRQQVVLTEQLTVTSLPNNPGGGGQSKPGTEQEALAQQNAQLFKKPKVCVLTLLLFYFFLLLLLFLYYYFVPFPFQSDSQGPIKRGGPVPKLAGVPTGSSTLQTLTTLSGSPRQNAGGVSPKAGAGGVSPKAGASSEETDLGKMFEGLQNEFMPIDALYTNKFVAPSRGQSKQKKIQMLPGRVSGNIAIFRRQYKFTDYEFMKYMFDVESDISSSINYEALLSIMPSAEQVRLGAVERAGFCLVVLF
jgi:hypothetical protein